LVHYVCGLINVKPLGGDAYFVTFIDYASKKVWDFPIKRKDKVLDTFSEISYGYWKWSNTLLRCIRIGNGEDYWSNEFK